MHNFQRTQVYLDQEQIQQLKSVSYKKEVPMSVLIRQAIDQFLKRGVNTNKTWGQDSLTRSVGKISLRTKTASVDHDRILYGSP